MSYYVFGTTLWGNYNDYLQAQAFENSIKGEIRSSTRALIATKEQLAHEQVVASNRASREIGRSFEQISFTLSEIQEHVATLNSTFEWGFSEMLTVVGRVADSLEELIRIAKNPSKTWAYEQFDDARDAYRKRLYKEAIEYLTRAIHGYGGQLGYELEYRFYYYLAVVRIGRFGQESAEVVDLTEAKKAFLSAARYAEFDYPKEAAKAFLGAGWAAYCKGEQQDARTYTEKAVSLDTSLAEGHFQLAKVLMHGHDVASALDPLKKAIQLDWKYTLKASADGDFAAHQDEVDALIASLKAEAKTALEEKLADFETKIRSLDKSRTEKFPLADRGPIEDLEELAKAIQSLGSVETYYGYLAALKTCDATDENVKKAEAKLRGRQQLREAELGEQRQLRAGREVASEVRKVKHSAKMAMIAMCLSISGVCLFFPAIGGLFLGVVALKDLAKCDSTKIGGAINIRDAKTQAIVAIVVGAFFTIVVGFSLFQSLVRTAR